MSELFALIGWVIAAWNVVRWATGHHIGWGNVVGGAILGVVFTALSVWRWRRSGDAA